MRACSSTCQDWGSLYFHKAIFENWEVRVGVLFKFVKFFSYSIERIIISIVTKITIVDKEGIYHLEIYFLTGNLILNFEVLQHLFLTNCWINRLYHSVKSVQIRSFFWSVFSNIRTEYGEIPCISPYSVQMRENTDQKKLRIWKHFTQWTVMPYLLQKCFYIFIFLHGHQL